VTITSGTIPNFSANGSITLGNTAIGLGNTATAVGNLTLNNTTITSGNANVTQVTATNGYILMPTSCLPTQLSV
jgi:hypothetical protein